MRSRAFVVRSATNSNALYLWISVVALLARAHRFVIFDSAFCVWRAAAWVAADIVDACFIRRTIRIRYAAADTNYRLQWFARATAAADVAFGANANHRAHRQRWDNFTPRWQLTRLEGWTWVDAFVIDASQKR